MKLTVNITDQNTRRLVERIDQFVRARPAPPPPRAEDERPPSPPSARPHPRS